MPGFIFNRYLSVGLNFLKNSYLFFELNANEFGYLFLLVAIRDIGSHLLFGSRFYLLKNYSSSNKKISSTFLKINKITAVVAFPVCFICLYLYFKNIQSVIISLYLIHIQQISTICHCIWNAKKETEKIAKIEVIIAIVSVLLILGLNEYLLDLYLSSMISIVLSPLIYIPAFYSLKIPKLSRYDRIDISANELFRYYRIDNLINTPLMLIKLIYPVLFGNSHYGIFSFTFSIANNLSFLIGGKLYYHAKQIIDQFNGLALNIDDIKLLEKTMIYESFVNFIVLLFLGALVLHLSDLLPKSLNPTEFILILCLFYLKFNNTRMRAFCFRQLSNIYDRTIIIGLSCILVWIVFGIGFDLFNDSTYLISSLIIFQLIVSFRCTHVFLLHNPTFRPFFMALDMVPLCLLLLL